MKFFVDDKVIVLPEDRGMNEQEFFNFCMANRDLNMERDKNGNILIMSPVFFKGGMLESRIIGRLYTWNEASGLGYAFSSQTGFTLPNKAVRSPDAAWISKERADALSEKEQESFAHICPDFVIELRSKTDKLLPLQEKMEEYISCGCQLGFLIDPYEKKAWIYSADGNIEEHTDFNGVLSGGIVLPGFELPLNIFV